MNARTWLGALGVCAALGGAATHAAAEDSQRNKVTMERGEQASAEELRQVTVTIREVKPEENRVVFEAKVRPEAGGSTQISELREGQQVRASFDPVTGEVHKLELMGPPQKSK